MKPSKEKSVSLPVISDQRVIRKSKSGRRRAVVLVTIQLLMIVHLVQWLITGRTMSPIEPSESMETVKSGVINAGAIFFAAALLATLVFGRWFCGWGCHIVLLQDGCAWIMRRIGIRPRAFRSRLLVYVPLLLALYMFVWPAVYRWGVVPLSTTLNRSFESIPALAPLPPWNGFRVEVVTDDLMQTFPTWIVAIPFFAICGFATVYFLGSKGFCTYGCPYGGFFAPLDQYAPARIRVTDACEHCGHCTAVCTSNVRVHEEVRDFGMVVDPGCMKCLDCVSVCPNDALYFGFGKPASGAKPRANARPAKPRYDLTLGEEFACAAVFLGCFLALRGVYDVIPMLMAVGIAGCITFMSWKTWRMLREPSVNLHRFRLRFRGAWSRSGIVFAAATVAALVLTAHSGVVNYWEFRANRADRRVTVPRAAIFSPAPAELPPAMREDADAAIRYLEQIRPIGEGGFGLLRNPENGVRRAWLHACRTEFAEAEQLLREYIARYGPTDFACRDIALLLNMQLREDEAVSFAEAIVRAHPEFIETTEGLITAARLNGQIDDAIRICRESVEANRDRPDNYLYMLRRLSLLLVDNGFLDEGIEVFLETIEIDDRNPASFVMLSRAYHRKGDMESARAAVQRAIDLAPDRTDLREEMSRFEQ